MLRIIASMNIPVIKISMHAMNVILSITKQQDPLCPTIKHKTVKPRTTASSTVCLIF